MKAILAQIKLIQDNRTTIALAENKIKLLKKYLLDPNNTELKDDTVSDQMKYLMNYILTAKSTPSLQKTVKDYTISFLEGKTDKYILEMIFKINFYYNRLDKLNSDELNNALNELITIKDKSLGFKMDKSAKEK
jgi:hypothetical protein